MAAKDILLKIKALFDGPAGIQPPVNPAPTTGATSCSYNVDGGGAVFVDISDDGIPDIDQNDKVFSDPALTVPYPDGTYNVTGTQFGFTVAGGIVSAVTDVAGTGPGAPASDPNAMTAPAPITATVPTPPTMEQRIAAIEAMLSKLTNPGAPAAMADEKNIVKLTAEAVAAMYAKFGTGNSNDRIDNLEIMVKALMESNFGYQIRQGLEGEAIQAYKDSIATQISGLVASAQKFEAEKERIKVLEAANAKNTELIKGFFELAETIVTDPKVTPITLNGTKKEKFNRTAKVEDRYVKALEELRDIRKAK